MKHRIDKLSTLLDVNETQLSLNEIRIEHENARNESSDENPCSSTIKFEPLLIPQSERFKSNSSYRKHKCETCNKQFPSPSLLNIHNRIHSKEKPFACYQCPKSFSQTGSLIIQKRIHSGEKPYQCDICPNKFSQLQHLTRHKLIHTGEKPAIIR